ncbi:hypothetical protein [Streptococcus catagoni]|nr:hypothetical protein [Streptococcus catagoni]
MSNANRELKDYNPKQEVYMAEARRKTTIDECQEIVNYCIGHNRNYKETAALYNISYLSGVHEKSVAHLFCTTDLIKQTLF